MEVGLILGSKVFLRTNEVEVGLILGGKDDIPVFNNRSGYHLDAFDLL